MIGSRRDIDAPGASLCTQAELLRTVYGCGAGLVAGTTCAGLTRLVDCDRNVGTWSCGNSLDASSQNKATNGVLCVPPKPSREALVAYLTSNLGGITGLWE